MAFSGYQIPLVSEVVRTSHSTNSRINPDGSCDTETGIKLILSVALKLLLLCAYIA